MVPLIAGFEGNWIDYSHFLRENLPGQLWVTGYIGDDLTYQTKRVRHIALPIDLGWVSVFLLESTRGEKQIAVAAFSLDPEAGIYPWPLAGLWAFGAYPTPPPGGAAADDRLLRAMPYMLNLPEPRSGAVASR